MSVSDYSLQYLLSNGYERKICAKCGRAFWTIDKNRVTCGEVPCDPYSFIGNPPTLRKYSLEEMREEFLSFFESRGHKRIKRYPIVARWRDDVYLVNASIYDFQPHVTSGKVPPPGNPLVISQPCIRTVDLDNVGKTGRHLSVFEMGGAKAFNFPGNEIYWKDRAVQLCLEFLSHLGVNREEVILKEKPWAGGGNAGSSFEVMVRGLEVATLVFMDMVEDMKGDIEIDGVRYRKMENRIVDTGYGIERFTWLSQGTRTIYDALYPDLISLLMKEADVKQLSSFQGYMDAVSMEDGSEIAFLSKLSPQERDSINKISSIYMLADHTRAITFLLFDGLVPSNSKAGYVLRMLIRRALLAIKKLDIKETLWNLIEIQENRFKDILDVRLYTSAKEIIRLEEERFSELLSKGDSLIKRYSKNGSISKEGVITLFESNGLPIEYVKERCEALGISFPQDLRKERGFSNVRKEQKPREMRSQFKETRKLYYENERMLEFTANIIGIEGDSVILDRTCFYPEGGGQPSDRGFIYVNGNLFKVLDVQVHDGTVYHKLENKNGIMVGQSVYGKVDYQRRRRLMQNHTATHILLSSVRDVLGPHIWQAGAQKDERISRLDVTHFSDISESQVAEIERRANEIIRMDLPIHKEFVQRNEAEEYYGFTLYQGGIPEGRMLRLVEIPGIDAEGCGGTHLDRTGEVGFIKILRVERIQDGVIRFHFSAGEAAVEYAISNLEEINRIKAKMGDNPLETFGLMENELDRIKKAISEGIEEESITVNGKEFKILLAREIIAEEVSKSIRGSAGIVISEERIRISSSYREISALDLIRILESKGLVKGGGSKDYSQGKVLKENLSVKDIKEAIADHSR
ncbi:MAG: alanine--tRNA ligase [Thermoplasmatales archaeon]